MVSHQHAALQSFVFGKNRGKKNGNEEQRKKRNEKFIPFQNSFFVYFLMTEMKNGSAGIRVISYRLITMREKEKPGGIAPTMVFRDRDDNYCRRPAACNTQTQRENQRI